MQVWSKVRAFPRISVNEVLLAEAGHPGSFAGLSHTHSGMYVLAIS